ncbi:MFS transporter [Sphingomonas rubra]|uniref:MFS transporter, DHA1 family, bicyclomycin/chloramphenicol resistance protein n=1 Tax=Sphingomonas rubra TaxID=634430 RepID=A0A1I5QK73_9SPHN|nr:MFS transporter [Sphingomonas rubra]SFP46653.1 MFS transporter, DHA1 family, bicyclomycin/chloramphenicol resistance protein [Sphingomonas rubra]
MTAQDHQAPAMRGAPTGFAEFVALVASLMALGALGTDAMLPALPAIGEALGVADENSRQFVVSAFLGGFGVAHLIHGPLVDRFGRRRVLLWAIAGYVVANAAAALAGSFTLLIAARIAGGATVAATRIGTVALVRDCYHGRAMARVMSIAFMVFMVVPVVAPSVGQLVLLVGDWRAIFWVIAGTGAALWVWIALRLPETLAPEDALPIHPRRIAAGWGVVLRDRQAVGYTLAATMLMGGLYGYLNSVQQIMFDVFDRPGLLAVVFAATAATMAAANLANARFVMRVGTRKIAHGAVLAMVVLAGTHLAAAWWGMDSLVVFAVLQALTMASFGLATSNFSAMAMENMGGVAGIASSVQGFASITAGVAIGAVIGQAFDGSTVPMIAGFLVVGLLSLGAIAWTERGRLFGA